MKTTIRGLTLAYEESGHGPALLFLHGYPLDRSMWRLQLHRLSSQARCIALDLRGCGESDAPVGIYDMDTFAGDVAGLMDHLKIERAVLCGLSMGGYIALAFAEHWPDRLAGLVLANTRAGADTEAGREARMNAVKVALEQGVAAIADSMMPRLLAVNTREQKPELVEQVREMMARQQAAGIAGALRGMAARPDRTALLSRINCPALIITGDSDALIPMSESEAMAAAIPGARLVVIPGAGHLSNLEQPEAFNTAIREFLQ